MSAWRLKLWAIGVIIVAVFPVRFAHADGGPPAPLRVASPGSDITDYIAYYVKQLKGDDTDAQSEARQKLIDGSRGDVPKSGTLDATFLDRYSTDLNTQLKALLSSNAAANVRARLNAGIIVYNVANEGGGTELTDSVILLLGDKSPAIITWGVKAAQPIMTALATAQPALPANTMNNPMQRMADAVIGVITADTSSSLVEDAYLAITAGYPAAPLSRDKPGQHLVLPHVQDFVAKRIKQYAAGSSSNPEPDSHGMIFLGGTWANQSPAEQKITMQRVSDMITVLGVRQARLPEADRAPYLNLLKHMPDAFKNTSVQALVQPLGNLPNGAAADVTAKASKAVADAIRSDPTWGPLQPAPAMASSDFGRP
jgi:hypothetical protein